MKNSVALTVMEDLLVFSGSRGIDFYSIRSEDHVTVIPAALVLKAEQTLPIRETQASECIIFLNPHCTTREEDGKMIFRYEVVGTHNPFGEEVYPDGYEFSIPKSIIKSVVHY